MLTGLGSTETAPFAIVCRSDTTASGVVGLPALGLDMKLAPVEGKLEVRVKGPNVTPGYWRDPAATAAVFDEEGYLKMGDALVWVDPADTAKGFRFDGRVAEDFKLSSGTWVSVGPLRARLIHHLAPHVRDVVIAGHDRDFLAAIGIPERPDLPEDAAAMAAIRAELAALARTATGSAGRIRRFTLLTGALSVDAGELTDKGSINQRAVLRNRPALVDELYAETPPPHVIAVG
jgi:feruloyl-CoA synthase